MKQAALVLSIVLASVGVAHAAAGKVLVCHETGAEDNPFVLISVAAAAFDAHIAHGDVTPDEAGNCTDDEGPPGGES